MKKRTFFIPVAVAASALMASEAAEALPANPIPKPTEWASADSFSTNPGTNVLKVQKTPDRADAFILKRDASGDMLAYHGSHHSHGSHTSHTSHGSHSSHTSSAY